MWTCIEERNGNKKFGRIVRKIVFGHIYATRTALLSSNPIPTTALEHLEVISQFNIEKCFLAFVLLNSNSDW